MYSEKGHAFRSAGKRGLKEKQILACAQLAIYPLYHNLMLVELFSFEKNDNLLGNM